TRGNTNNLVSLLTRTSHPDTYSGSTRTIPDGCDPEKLTDRGCRFIALDSPESATYNTPIDPDLGQCQANYIVLFSDGAANATTQSSAISAAIGSTCSGENCAEALATYMATKPSERNVNNNDAQTFTYTVGFESTGFNSTYLENLAEAGSGEFYSGSTISELADAFSSILIEAKKGASTFVAPGISVNQFNRLTHSNDIYYALFDPKSTEYWPGNLKKYKLIDSVVMDNTTSPAISTDGFFKDSAHDWWATSASLSGPFVGRGGAASRQSAPRNVYSNMANSSVPFTDGDDRLTKSKLGISGEPNSNSLRLSMVDWIRGYDATDLDDDGVTNEPRYQMADPLHSEPLFFQYSDRSSVFIGTNEGYVLSIDAETGVENWAFIPEDLLPNLHNYYENDSVFNTRTYGMDGAINAWTEDGKSYIIVGQRRGGRNYYVLDVTSPTQPIFKYMIEGGTGDYRDLGQSWSKPTITKIKENGTERRVFVIGGGYDTNQDSNTFRDKDNEGTSVFIVDVSDGRLIAEIKDGGSHDVDDMDYSIPSRVAVIDRDFDGFMDHMYFADMGGNLFRVDVYNDESLNQMFKGEKIYTTSQNFSRSKNRRFYYAPDVAEIVHQQEHYYAVSIGSGYRAHPLNEDIDDSVLMIKDKGVFAPDEDGEYTFPTISNIAQLDATTPSVDDISSYDGYEFNLTRGEKVITGVTVINSKLIFTTYDPSSAGLIENSCSAAQGGGRLYIIDLLDGSAIQDNDGDGDVDYDDTFITLDKSGIPAEPRLIITDPESPTICIGTECADTVVSDDDQNDEFKRFTSSISGMRSRLNQVFINSWSTELEPTTKDDN
ncbi:PilC/PilY family type IV pilus protein, partial [Psychrosphaera sp.]|nr:PilC/PilY family type IV pilus protein [Psychrosphaera sp.]